MSRKCGKTAGNNIEIKDQRLDKEDLVIQSTGKPSGHNYKLTK